MRNIDLIRMSSSDSAHSNSRSVVVALALLLCALPLHFVVLLMTYADQILNRNMYFIVSSTVVAGKKWCAESGLQLRYRFFYFCWVRLHCPFSTPSACFGAYTVRKTRVAHPHYGLVREEPSSAFRDPF
jgi:hypothetical protein